MQKNVGMENDQEIKNGQNHFQTEVNLINQVYEHLLQQTNQDQMVKAHGIETLQNDKNHPIMHHNDAESHDIQYDLLYIDHENLQVNDALPFLVHKHT